MMNNPEFRRNIWLELTPYRVIGMPVVLGALFVLVFMVSAERGYEATAYLSLMLYSAIIFLWGTRQAAEAVVAEVRDRTWDSQRMSGIEPWSMTWGKLLGSTVYPWYGGVLCLTVYAIVTTGNPEQRTVSTLVLYLVCGLLAHAVALLSSMQALKKDRHYNKSQAAAFLVLGVIMVGPALSTAFYSKRTYQWFNETFQGRDFIMFSALMFLVWMVVGIYRLMRTELQLRNGPFVWLGFTAFLILYCAGFINAAEPRELLFDRFFVAYVVALLLTYGMAISERKDPVSFKRLIVAYGKKDWKRVLQELPCWATTLLPALVAGAGMFLSAYSIADPVRTAAGLQIFISSSSLFLLRDLGLLLFFNFAKNPKRADMIMVLCLGLLYGIIPGILSALQLDAMTSLFWPNWERQSFLACVPAGIEVLIVWLLVLDRWKTYNKPGLDPART